MKRIREYTSIVNIEWELIICWVPIVYVSFCLPQFTLAFVIVGAFLTAFVYWGE